MACLLLCFGFHPKVFIFVMSSSMFLTSPFQPLPPSGILVSESYDGELRVPKKQGDKTHQIHNNPEKEA
jgi:hypothetical protein